MDCKSSVAWCSAVVALIFLVSFLVPEHGCSPLSAFLCVVYFPDLYCSELFLFNINRMPSQPARPRLHSILSATQKLSNNFHKHMGERCTSCHQLLQTKNAIMLHQNKNKKFVEKINSHTSLVVDANQ